MVELEFEALRVEVSKTSGVTQGDEMSIKKVNIVITGIKNSKRKKIYETKWAGDLDDWMMEIGGEFAGAIEEDYDEVIMSAERV